MIFFCLFFSDLTRLIWVISIKQLFSLTLSLAFICVYSTGLCCLRFLLFSIFVIRSFGILCCCCFVCFFHHPEEIYIWHCQQKALFSHRNQTFSKISQLTFNEYSLWNVTNEQQVIRSGKSIMKFKTYQTDNLIEYWNLVRRTLL